MRIGIAGLSAAVIGGLLSYGLDRAIPGGAGLAIAVAASLFCGVILGSLAA
jgi:hypothetical protein